MKQSLIDKILKNSINPSSMCIYLKEMNEEYERMIYAVLRDSKETFHSD